MLNQFLEEIYFKFLEPVSISTRKDVFYDLSKPEQMVWQMIPGEEIEGAVYEYNGKLLTTQNDYEEALSVFPLQQLEVALLDELFILSEHEDYYSNWDVWENLSLIKKCERLQITDYLSDRNLNDLIMHYYFLKEFLV